MTREATRNAIPAELLESEPPTPEQAAAYEELIQILEDSLRQPATREEQEGRAVTSATDHARQDTTAHAQVTDAERPFGSGT